MIGLAAPLFGLLALAAGLVWFLHARRERRVVVSSLVLWRQIQERAGVYPKARLVPPITTALLLQLLAIALVTLALTQPYWGRSAAPEHVAIVLDASAGMQARTDEGTLFAAAQEAVREAMGGRDRAGPDHVSLVAGGVAPRIVAARWPWEAEQLEGTLAAAGTSDGPTDWPALARLLQGVLRETETSRVLFVSDRLAPQVVRDAAGPAQLIEHIVSAQGPDAGIGGNLTPVDMAAGVWAFEGAVTFRGERAAVTVEIQYTAEIGRTPLDWAEFTVAAPEDGTGVAAFSEELELPGPGFVTAIIDSDATPADNRLRFVVPSGPETLDVLYIGVGDQPLLRALGAIDGVALYQDDAIGPTASDYDLVVLDRVETDRLPATNVLVIAPPDSGTTALADPDPDGWTEAHPLARAIDWAGLTIRSAAGVEAPPAGTVLLEADGEPLISTLATPTGRVVRLGFDPAQSNWPELPSFPAFAANLVNWLGLDPGAVPQTACVVGAPCPLDARLMSAPIVDLDAPRTATAVPLSEWVPTQAGLFVVGSGERMRVVAVNPAAVEAHNGVAANGAQAELPHGLALWLLVAGGLVIAVEGVMAAHRRGWVPLVSPLRVVAVVLMIGAVANVPLPWLTPGEAVVLIVPEGARQGGDARVEAGPSPRVGADLGGDTAPLEAMPAARISHADGALALGAALIPPGREGRIVLAGAFSTSPGAMDVVAGRGIPVDYLDGAETPEGEVLVDRLDLPRQIYASDSVPLTGLVHAAAPAEVALEILSGGAVVAQQDVALAPGQNRVEAVLPALAAGENLVQLRVAAGDGFPQNDAMGRIVRATPIRPVAVIASDPAHGEAFARLLEGQGLDAEAMTPDDAPHYIADWLGYGGIVLIDTPALGFTTRQHALIETAIAEHGMGLVILGGPNAYGPGGYFGTPLEALSPLSSRVPQDAPEVAMVFVLDRSGSMQQPVGAGTRLDIAKTATASAMDLLHPQSQVGIVVFDAEAQTLLPLTRLEGNLEAAQGALEGFDPGGGTSIYPGLVAARDMLLGVEAPAKHVVVMTDGLSQPGDFPGILADLRGGGVTVSAVAIGRGADGGTARRIATLGGGSSHATTDFEALPSILSQEAMLLASPIEEGATQPQWVSRTAPFLAALPARLPPIGGFVATTAKPEADLAVTAPDAEGRDMPVLAYWRYGNGMVLALAMDGTGPWSANWQGLPGYGALWADVLRAFQPATPRPGLTLAAHGNGEYLDLEVNALDPEGQALRGEQLVAMVTSPQDDTARPVPLTERQPGLYGARYVLDAPGRYEISLEAAPETEPVAAAYYHSYDAQYAFSRPNSAAALAAATGGRALSLAELEALGTGPALGLVRAWPVWALAAFLLFIIDLIVRYRGAFSRRASQRPPANETRDAPQREPIAA